jgi:hypothetical protein
METERQQAYQVVLAAGLLHVKWDLACWQGGFDWLQPWRLPGQVRAARRAACRSAAFHNLAIFASQAFAQFSEERFWQDVERLYRDFPESTWANYREMFERSLQGHEVCIVRPGG